MLNLFKSIRPLVAGLCLWGTAVLIGCQAWRVLKNPVPGLVETSPGVWQQGRKPDDGWMVLAGAAGVHFLLGVYYLRDFIISRRKPVPASSGHVSDGGENSAVSPV